LYVIEDAHSLEDRPRDRHLPDTLFPTSPISPAKAAIQRRRELMVDRTQVAVVGRGPSGLAASSLVAEAGIGVTLITGRAPNAGDDPRTVALMQPSIRLLAHLGIWPGEMMARSAPLWRLKLVDDSGGLVASPPVVFDAREIGPAPFGWSIPIGALTAALEQRACDLGVAFLEDEAVRLQTSGAAGQLSSAGCS
jgi:2-polyprenyl-6-methoxyphenol hydroxylase-like FAD-dependent oxidoreductase